MHILATFFALLLSFGHASSVRRAMALPAPASTISTVEFTPRPAFIPARTAALAHVHTAR